MKNIFCSRPNKETQKLAVALQNANVSFGDDSRQGDVLVLACFSFGRNMYNLPWDLIFISVF
jgi:hypothetical protein